MNRNLWLGASVLLISSLCFSQASEIARRLGLQTGLSDSKISSGLKQALQIGAEQAVKLTGRPNGYFGNPNIKILMPNNLRTLEKGLRMVGYGPKVDDFILSMNRAAEAAAPAARKIFIDAITAMTFEDARRILSGGRHRGHRLLQGEDHAATDRSLPAGGRENDVNKRCDPAIRRAHAAIQVNSVRQKSGSGYQPLRRLQGARRLVLPTWPGRAQDSPGPRGADNEPSPGSLR